jgi:hypothetical protein
MQFSGSQVALGTNLGITNRNLKARTSFLKRVTGRIFAITIVIGVIETSRNFIFTRQQNHEAQTKCTL